jgi:hypothetical protein
LCTAACIVAAEPGNERWIDCPADAASGTRLRMPDAKAGLEVRNLRRRSPLR